MIIIKTKGINTMQIKNTPVVTQLQSIMARTNQQSTKVTFKRCKSNNYIKTVMMLGVQN